MMEIICWIQTVAAVLLVQSTAEKYNYVACIRRYLMSMFSGENQTSQQWIVIVLVTKSWYHN